MTPPSDLSFLLNQFRSNVPGVSHAIAVSADGLLLAATTGLDTAAAERLAAVACGLTSLLRGAAATIDGGHVVSNLTELGGGFLYTMSVSSGASLFVMSARGADIGAVSYEMAELINQVGPVLTPQARNTTTPMSTGPVPTGPIATGWAQV